MAQEKKLNVLVDLILSIIPNAKFSEDPDGQLIIHTGLEVVSCSDPALDDLIDMDAKESVAMVDCSSKADRIETAG